MKVKAIRVSFPYKKRLPSEYITIDISKPIKFYDDAYRQMGGEHNEGLIMLKEIIKVNGERCLCTTSERGGEILFEIKTGKVIGDKYKKHWYAENFVGRVKCKKGIYEGMVKDGHKCNSFAKGVYYMIVEEDGSCFYLKDQEGDIIKFSKSDYDNNNYVFSEHFLTPTEYKYKYYN